MGKNLINEKIILKGKEYQINQQLPILNDMWFELTDNNELEIVSCIRDKQKIVLNRSLFSQTPILIKSMSKNLIDNKERLQLLYYKQDKKEWDTMGIYCELNDTQMIQEFCSKNIPICKGNIGVWKVYLSELKLQNFETLPIYYF